MIAFSKSVKTHLKICKLKVLDFQILIIHLGLTHNNSTLTGIYFSFGSVHCNIQIAQNLISLRLYNLNGVVTKVLFLEAYVNPDFLLELFFQALTTVGSTGM